MWDSKAKLNFEQIEKRNEKCPPEFLEHCILLGFMLKPRRQIFGNFRYPPLPHTHTLSWDRCLFLNYFFNIVIFENVG